MKATEKKAASAPLSKWSFLTNHTHVLVCLTREKALTVRELAIQIGITERSVQRILSELERDGVITRKREGRNNSYEINKKFQLRHALEQHHTIADLIKAIL
ncbi:winged helix-turn-helix domain-containing protein [bacterium]|nr:winged helix-turn-helix domain-containing protein [Akkermansiaceae bacterium]MDB4407048.1 winged helix-turn-helix domain-containing protein [bacterium]MDB4411985.1 winged helix-turn-helix domain-containing protein [Akkermansiaceae bacterium]MDB4492149.1 winged helix-turn-helix domain-containing protein [bacterium]MDB4532599.1 winged helix-turn-helix domain-containing protein [bacterium]